MEHGGPCDRRMVKLLMSSLMLQKPKSHGPVMSMAAVGLELQSVLTVR